MSQTTEPKKINWGTRTLNFHRVNPSLSELHVFFSNMFSFYFNKLSGVKQQILFMILWIRNSGRVCWVVFSLHESIAGFSYQVTTRLLLSLAYQKITLPYPYILSSVFNSLYIYLADKKKKMHGYENSFFKYIIVWLWYGIKGLSLMA